MTVRITPDANKPTASVELPMRRPLEEYEIETVEMKIPRDVDEVLVKRGFRDLLDDAQGILEEALAGKGLKVVQLTGAMSCEGGTFRPGVWLVLEEEGAKGDGPMSGEAQQRVAEIAETLRRKLKLS